jgi:hypothetical protein
LPQILKFGQIAGRRRSESLIPIQKIEQLTIAEYAPTVSYRVEPEVLGGVDAGEESGADGADGELGILGLSICDNVLYHI